MDHGVEIKQSGYYMAVMQKIISQYDRTCDKIKRIADTTNERNNALFELINSYVERGIGHEDIESDTEDHKLDNTYTCMKNV